MCLKLTARIPERPQWHCSDVLPLLPSTGFKHLSDDSTCDFEQLNPGSNGTYFRPEH